MACCIHRSVIWVTKSHDATLLLLSSSDGTSMGRLFVEIFIWLTELLLLGYIILNLNSTIFWIHHLFLYLFWFLAHCHFPLGRRSQGPAASCWSFSPASRCWLILMNELIKWLLFERGFKLQRLLSFINLHWLNKPRLAFIYPNQVGIPSLGLDWVIHVLLSAVTYARKWTFLFKSNSSKQFVERHCELLLLLDYVSQRSAK